MSGLSMHPLPRILPRGGGRLRVRARRAAPLALIGAPILGLLAFFYFPVATVLLRGFASPDGGFSLRAALDVVSDPYVLRLLRFTAWQALWSSLFSVLLGAPMAYVLARLEFAGRRVVTALTMVPFVLPSMSVALGFLLMFGSAGWLNQALRALFGTELRVLHSIWAILLAHTFYNAPVVARMVQSAWEGVDPRLEESARSLGASPFTAWRDVTLPAILPALVGGGALAFIFSFMSFPIVLALGGARFSTLEVEIFTQVQVLWDLETGAALAAVQAAVSLAFIYVILRTQKEAAPFGGGPAARPRLPLEGRPATVWQGAILLFMACAALFFVGPIASIAVHALKHPQGGLSWDGFLRIASASHHALIGNSPFGAVANSLRFAVIAACLALIAGTAFTYGLVRVGWRKTAWIETLTLLPLVVSSVALGLGVLVAFRRPPFDAIPADWRVISIHAVLAFPFVVRAVRPVLANLDRGLADAARTLGAGPGAAFFSVELPLMAGGVWVAFALAFGLSVSEMSATVMLARPGLVTMPISVYRFLSARDFQSASAMAVVLALVTAGAFLAAEWGSKALGREGRNPSGRAS